MTNPDNIVRVRARNGGRASVYEANGWAQAYSAGILEGSGVIQNTPADMNVLVGGSATKPDVVLASNPAGYKIALDIIGQQAVAITAPASNKRISVIVAYTDDLSLATTQDTVTGSPASCGLIVVNGTAANSPTAPTDAQIRTAITSDGATGSQAAYCVLAEILVENGTTAVDNSMITPKIAAIGADNIDFTTITGGDMPVATFALHIPYFPTGVYAQIRRIGNTVVATADVVASNLAIFDSVSVVETMPSGFRPLSGTVGIITLNAVVGISDSAAMIIKPNGSITWSNRTDVTGSTRFNGSGTWITKDAFPSP